MTATRQPVSNSLLPLGLGLSPPPLSCSPHVVFGQCVRTYSTESRVPQHSRRLPIEAEVCPVLWSADAQARARGSDRRVVPSPDRLRRRNRRSSNQRNPPPNHSYIRRPDGRRMPGRAASGPPPGLRFNRSQPVTEPRTPTSLYRTRRSSIPLERNRENLSLIPPPACRPSDRKSTTYAV